MISYETLQVDFSYHTGQLKIGCRSEFITDDHQDITVIMSVDVTKYIICWPGLCMIASIISYVSMVGCPGGHL